MSNAPFYFLELWFPIARLRAQPALSEMSDDVQPVQHYALASSNMKSLDTLEERSHLRSQFPETWLWTEEVVGYKYHVNCRVWGEQQNKVSHKA